MFDGAAPDFALQGGLPLALVRALVDAALISAFGALLFRALILPRHADARVEQVIARLARASAGGGAALLLAWLALEARMMSGGQILGAIPAVLADTDFGHLVAAQCGLLVLTAIVPTRFAIVSAFVALAAQAGHSHAFSMYGVASLLFVADLLHLGAAGAWLGALLPLLLTIGLAPAQAAIAARRFSPLGIAAVVALAASALFQGVVLVGTWPALVGTAYGWVVLCKIVLFVALFGCAALNRTRFTPACAAGQPAMLARSIAVETGLGLAVVIAAATLSGLEPGAHSQVVWPFAWRPNLDAVSEDAAIGLEVIAAGCALGVAALLLAMAILLRRRWRWGAVVVAAGLVWVAVPHLAPLLVDAYPTSYFHSTTGFTADSIVAGARLYPANCARCHGPLGRGDSRAASGLMPPAADLTAAHLRMHRDGELFWWLTHGMPTPAGQPAMPGFARVLSDDERWALIDFIRARNGGSAQSRTGDWIPPLPAPGFQAACAGGRSMTLAELRGRDVRLVIGSAPDAAGVLTVLATSDAGIRADAHRCVTNDETVPRAYAIVAGLPPDRLAGTQFLIDANGWLRAVQASGTKGGWDDARSLAAALDAIDHHRIAGSHAPTAMQM